MIETVRREPSTSWFSVVLSAWHDPAARVLNVDLLTVLIAVLLPWTTTGVVIAAVLWILALVPTIKLAELLRLLKHPVFTLPIAMFALALLGTLWSDASWSVRLYAVGPTAKLLVLPLLLYHFERSPRGAWVFIAFLASCTLLMAGSWVGAFYPNLSFKPYFSHGSYLPVKGIVVKNYIDQSQEFALCAVALAHPIIACFRANKMLLGALLVAIALGLTLNMVFVVISRTAFVTMPIMVAVFALLHLGRRTAVLTLGFSILLAISAWSASSNLRATISKFAIDYQETQKNHITGMYSRLEYWQKSLHFLAEAPVIGHGTGSTRGLFEQAAVGQIDAHAEVVANPHNQTLNVAVQWGVVGIVVLYAMWLVHLLLFRGDGLTNWIGLLVVVQNIFTSLFNSHLFDFHEGWLYVLGVGVAGGMTVGARGSAKFKTVMVDDRPH